MLYLKTIAFTLLVACLWPAAALAQAIEGSSDGPPGSFFTEGFDTSWSSSLASSAVIVPAVRKPFPAKDPFLRWNTFSRRANQSSLALDMVSTLTFLNSPKYVFGVRVERQEVGFPGRYCGNAAGVVACNIAATFLADRLSSGLYHRWGWKGKVASTTLNFALAGLRVKASIGNFRGNGVETQVCRMTGRCR